MYCPTCGNEITVELKYCNRCGANLTLPAMTTPVAMAPVKLTVPSIVLSITILGGLGVIFGSATEFARQGLHPAAIVWMVLFSAATLFGCTGLLIRFLSNMKLRNQLYRVFQSVMIFLLAVNVIVVAAQTRQPTRRSAPVRNRAISNIVREIDARNIEATIRKLVSFGTRNTLSEQNDPNRGIGAARDWLYAEFLKAAAASNGRMTVEKQSFEQPKAARVPEPKMLTNVVATLKGSQPESTDRIYVVSGHYDSMCNTPVDAKCDAPGANDDASGTAAVLEMARVMAKYEFDATIVFMAVAGEEQSLLGSTHFAEQAKQKNWHVDAMFTNDIVGNTLGGNGVRDRGHVRVFSEGVPSNETPAEATTRRSVGGENDSASRQLARFIKETGDAFVPQFEVMMIYRRDRYGRGGDPVSYTHLTL